VSNDDSTNPIEAVRERLHTNGWLQNGWGPPEGPNCLNGAAAKSTPVRMFNVFTAAVDKVVSEQYPERLTCPASDQRRARHRLQQPPADDPRRRRPRPRQGRAPVGRDAHARRCAVTTPNVEVNDQSTDALYGFIPIQGASGQVNLWICHVCECLVWNKHRHAVLNHRQPLRITEEGWAALAEGPSQMQLERDVLRDELARLVLAVRTWARPSEPVVDACERAERFILTTGGTP
jgi:hypothetical protein